MLILNENDNATFQIKVLVQFAQMGCTVKQGDFVGTFRREDPAVIQRAIADGVSNVALIAEGWDDDDGTRIEPVLVAADGIGRSASEMLPPDQALAFVRKSAECVNAAAIAFIKATRAERYIEETSKKRASRG